MTGLGKRVDGPSDSEAMEVEAGLAVGLGKAGGAGLQVDETGSGGENGEPSEEPDEPDEQDDEEDEEDDNDGGCANDADDGLQDAPKQSPQMSPNSLAADDHMDEDLAERGEPEEPDNPQAAQNGNDLDALEDGKDTGIVDEPEETQDPDEVDEADADGEVKQRDTTSVQAGTITAKTNTLPANATEERSTPRSREKGEVRPGCRVQCLWRDGQWRLCEILEQRKKPGTDILEYYVHYETFNRRLDEWVELDRFDLKTLKQKVRTREERDRARKRDGKRKRPPTAGEEKKEEKTTEEKAHEEATKIKNIQTIILGKWAIDSWYYSPFPKELTGYSTIRVCDFCLDFFRSKEAHRRHSERCLLHHPPGDEIYRKDHIAMFEVDGIQHKRYCQNLCYIAKLFLDHKTLFYDTDPFYFYILCEIEADGYHMVGYFSKEKASEENYNVACILTMPPVQRKGYGKFLIAFSYELSKIEGRPGSPEKPLSDLGLLGYRSYWSQVLVDLLRKEEHSQLSIQEMSQITMMKTEDIISTLQVLNLIQYADGQHIIDLRKVQNMKLGSRGFPVDPSKICWTPKTNKNTPGSKVTLHL